MSKTQRVPSFLLALGALVSLALAAPAVAQVEVEEEILAVPAGASWDETSGYGSVELIRAEASLVAEPASLTSLVPADARWAPESSLVVGRATCLDYLPAALASGRRAESSHLATVPLPGQDMLDGAAAC